MSIPVIDMIDTIHANVNDVPAGSSEIAGYVSGSADIDWTSADWARFSHARKIRIYQGNGAVGDVHRFDVIDVESGAVTPQQAVDITAERIAAGIQWTTVYGGDSALSQVSALARARGTAFWNGHFNAWLANWNLNRAQADTVVGTQIHGMTCIGVQWASPSSNPNTVLPGSTLTLQQSNCDLSVVNAGWIPSGGFPGPTPPAPVVNVIPGFVVYGPGSSFTGKMVHSSDGGATWK